MNYFGKTIFIFSLTVAMATSLVGCDKIQSIISPKKEAEKAPAQIATTPENNTPAATVETQGPLPADVIVRVGSWQLTNDEFNQRLKLLKQGLPDFDEKDPQTKATVLDELIRQQLLVGDAESSDIAQQKDIKEAVEDFRRTLLVQELATRLTKGVVATEEDAKKYYEDNKNLFVEPVKWKVRQIVVEDEAAANALLVQLLQGGDFDALAKAQSKDKSAAQGGVLPEFVKFPFEAMDKFVASVEPGKTSTVFKGPQGFYIVRVDEKKGGLPKPLAEIKKDLTEGLTLQKQQRAILEHINKLAEKTKVDVNKELLGLEDKIKK